MAIYVKGFLIALKGLPTTLYVSAIAVVCGVIIGLCLALMKLSNSKIARFLSTLYIELFRSTPLLVQALIVAYGIPIALQKNGIQFNWQFLVLPALIVCGLNSGAYVAEVLRSGIQAVDPGQVEAAMSLGMTKGQANRLIVWPQALRICIPALGNEFVTMIKETSVLSYVGVIEVLRKAALWNAATFETFPAYIGAALVYLMVCYPLSRVVRRLEIYMDQDGTEEKKVKSDRKFLKNTLPKKEISDEADLVANQNNSWGR